MVQQPLSLIVYEHYEDNPDLTIMVDMGNETVWVTQRQIADLLGLSIPTVNSAIKRIKRERGDTLHSTIRSFLIVAEDGKSRSVEHYDLTVVNLIGSRAHHSEQVAAFQNWVGQQLNRLVVANQQKQTPPFEASKRYKELRRSGLTHEESIEREDVDRAGKDTYKEIAGEWHRRDGSIPVLANHTMRLVTGKSATTLKRELKITVSPRAYIPTPDRAHLTVIESIGAILHRKRNSQGTEALERDLDDAAQVIDRDKLDAMFNNKSVLPPDPKPIQRRLPKG